SCGWWSHAIVQPSGGAAGAASSRSCCAAAGPAISRTTNAAAARVDVTIVFTSDLNGAELAVEQRFCRRSCWKRDRNTRAPGGNVFGEGHPPGVELFDQRSHPCGSVRAHFEFEEDRRVRGRRQRDGHPGA